MSDSNSLLGKIIATRSLEGDQIVSVGASTVESKSELPKEEPKAAPVVKPAGPCYRGIFLNQVLLKGGRLEKSADGNFYPGSNEEAIAKLDYFCTVGRAEKLSK